ncbi:hypothetical protein WJT74_05900 [Sphingomicrobium sp. XHP0239]|uniref:hypothetical protein n=1 Tax=Sphingomicrobium maritimum TaxID=3133972 RepID=UPI0031CCB8FB
MIEHIVTRAIPAAAQAGLQSGELSLFGSVIRHASSGQIAYHLQETGAVAKFLASANPLGGIGKFAEVAAQLGGDMMLYRQGQQIKESVELVLAQQVTGLALSGAALGVSVLGFAALSRKIGKIDSKIDALAAGQDAILSAVEDLRSATVTQDLVDLKTIAQQWEESWSLSSPAAQLERVADGGHRLANRFHERAMVSLTQHGDVLAASPLLDAHGLAQATRIAARLASDEKAAAIAASHDAMLQYDELVDHANATRGAIEHLGQEWDATSAEGREALQRQLADRRHIATALRDRADATDATSDLIKLLAQRSANGRAFLERARAEEEAPFLLIEASN